MDRNRALSRDQEIIIQEIKTLLLNGDSVLLKDLDQELIKFQALDHIIYEQI